LFLLHVAFSFGSDLIPFCLIQNKCGQNCSPLHPEMPR